MEQMPKIQMLKMFQLFDKILILKWFALKCEKPTSVLETH